MSDINRVRIFHFIWERHDYQKVISTSLTSPEHILNQADCKGLYYITGQHFIYGQETLLYIGQTQGQRFGYRLNKHEDFDINNIPRINSFYTGKLLDRDDGNLENWNFAISISETLLINSHLPAFNSQNVKGLPDKTACSDIIICNWGDYGFLLPEVSGLRFSNKYWDHKYDSDKPLSE